MSCARRGFHYKTECEQVKVIPRPIDAPKPKRLRSGLLDTRERDAPDQQRALFEPSKLLPLLYSTEANLV